MSFAAIDDVRQRDMRVYYLELPTASARAAYLQGIAFALGVTRQAVITFLDVVGPLGEQPAGGGGRRE